MLLMFTLTRDLLVSLGFCVIFIGWWGWLFWFLEVFPSVDLALALFLLTITPISISQVLGFLLSKYTGLGLRSRIYTSVSAYYIIGTLYFTLSKILLGRAPDIDFKIALPIWLTILLISTFISSRFVKSIVK
ncbi:MAG: hypothetical protein QXH10_09090 [Ignisphaera sp.]|uniref:Uncharacterized protein n=1 Tax=Ignisphaera aggregans TaxID=334771 RepID=A0A832CWE2_9CREN